MRYRIYLNEYCMIWYKNNRRHRLYGPAKECFCVCREWYKNGRFHRLDGPAVEYFNGYKEWYIDGIEYSEEVFKRIQTGEI